MKYGLSDEIYKKIETIVRNNSKYVFKLFGSRARGDYKSVSDIDIAVIGTTEAKDRFNILNEFDKLDIIYTIDIVFVEEVKKQELLNSIDREGIVI